MTDSQSLHTPNLNNASDFLVAAGLQFTHVAADRVEGVIDLGPEHHQPWGWSTAVSTPRCLALTAPQQVGARSDAAAGNERNCSVRNRASADGREIDQ